MLTALRCKDNKHGVGPSQQLHRNSAIRNYATEANDGADEGGDMSAAQMELAYEQPEGVSDKVWEGYAYIRDRTSDIDTLHNLPKQSSLENLILEVSNAEELRLLVPLVARWRLCKGLQMTEKITQFLIEASGRVGEPEIVVEILMDRWRYKLFPTSYGVSLLFKQLGDKAREAVKLEGEESETAKALVDQMYQVFVAYEEYGVEQDRFAYGALISASIEAGTDLGWERAVAMGEEAVKAYGDKPKLTFEAAHGLRGGFVRRGDTEKANKYTEVIENHGLKRTKRPIVHYDKEGRMKLQDRA
ncbi:hypothetical protein EV182_005316 [Spiromyces aspiralis]|uniref:Uncharacterized protein n=1 Tax=Spiromyces aspiralis TaxID=68401 RepID=A0ACC1HRH7_9FUNG|nr:hypothetical protein EV182_005316 [Spiromyces aspiralis]